MRLMLGLPRALPAALLSGCALAPDLLTGDEVAPLSADSSERMSAEQEPVVGAIDLYEAMARSSLLRVRAAQDDRQTSPITSATYQREIVEIKRSIQELQRDLSTARTQLSALSIQVIGAFAQTENCIPSGMSGSAISPTLEATP